MWFLSVAATSFLAAFAVIFTVSNPIGCALIYSQITLDLSRKERIGLARRIAINSGLVLAIATWAGSIVLSFLGVGIAALRIATAEAGTARTNRAIRHLSWTHFFRSRSPLPPVLEPSPPRSDWAPAGRWTGWRHYRSFWALPRPQRPSPS